MNPKRSAGSTGSFSSLQHSNSENMPLYWTDDLPVCQMSGVGSATNQVYRDDGIRHEGHEFEDRFCRFRCDESTYLYGIFDGHMGSKASAFAAQRLPAELLLGQLNGKKTEKEILEVLQQAFVSVEKCFFHELINNAIEEKCTLLQKMPEGLSSEELQARYPDLFQRIQVLDAEISVCTDALVALVINNRLYIANVGCCRALLCRRDPDGRLRVVQLTAEHNLDNEDERRRLIELGVNVDELRRRGSFTFTRTIGGHLIKTSYKDIDLLSSAKSEPLIATAELHGGIELDQSCCFLALMTDGMYQSLVAVKGSEEHVNVDIVTKIVQEFNIQSTLNGVAQAVVDKVVRVHHDTFMTAGDDIRQRCQARDDIALVVRQFNFDLPNAVVSPSSNPRLGIANSVAKTTPMGPLSLIIPTSNGTTMGDSNRAFFNASRNTIVRTNETNGDNTLDSTLSSLRSDTDTNDQGSRSVRNMSSVKAALPLDEDGRIPAYVDFDSFHEAIRDMTEAQLEAFYADTEPKPDFETIPEEKEPNSPGSFLNTHL